MTKYSKIAKSSFAVIVLSLILCAVLAFGGTYAYFTAKETKNGTITMATLGISPLTLTTQSNKVVPGQDALTAPVSFTSTATTNVPMIMLAKVEIQAQQGATITASAAPNSTWEEVPEQTGYYAFKGTGSYKTAGTASEEFTVVDSVFVDRTNGNEIMGKTLTITVTVWAMQADWVGGVNGAEYGDATAEATTSAWTAATVYSAIQSYFEVGGADL